LIAHASILNRMLGTEEAVYMLFTWSHGTFNFEPGVTPEATVERLTIEPQSLMLEGARRVDEWALIAKKIPSFNIVYALDRRALLDNEHELTPEQECVAKLVDGQRDVRAIVVDSGLSEFAAGKALYALLSAGFVARVGVSQPAKGPSVTADRATEHRNLGIAFYKTGMYEEAAREFRRVDALREDDPSASFYLGLVALRLHQWDAAIHEFERHVAHGLVTPRALRPGAYVNLAYAYERRGDLDRARATLIEALAHGGRSDPLVHTNLAAIAIAMHDHDAAELALATARTLWSTHLPPPTWYHYAGLNAALSNDLDRAIAVLSEGVRIYASQAILWNNLAVAYEARGYADDAMRTLERGLVEDPTLPQLHRNFADCLQRAGRFDEAREAYRRAHTLDIVP
jgi:tetratricopeptide (TPR) repeat protein